MMVHRGSMQRALLCSALCVCIGLAPAAQGQELPVECGPPGGLTRTGVVDHVTDGDTVRLEDGTRVRLIGLDAPEIHWSRDEAEPYAREARRALQEILDDHDDRVVLHPDDEDRDPHGRTLAHLFTPDGTPIAALLLERGLATALTIPPNDRHLECYRATEARARASREGLWSLPRHQVFQAEELPRDAKGFRLVEGEVTRIGESRRAHWINLDGGAAALRIDKADMGYFPGLDPEGLEGKRVQGRGYVYTHRGQPRMRIRHPADLEILEDTGDAAR
ncbi:thermonuclease family protein [Ectothiorhodospira mobilis]|uniref:thermonuclease family protein n=1 Tax=Ectothiorhodospira mobilis TaxID=195064 RepID=UPI001EE955A0|nr:thermonuclease family protein [Ectothiorhodospira mobilis]MCG5534614.1 thermonuclease family protein [Ectothiorhodospira mobilis]